MDEFARIARIAAILGSPGPGSVGLGIELGIGDDAAVLAPTGRKSVVTVDAAVDGVHFRRDWMTFEDVGYRATVAAASDVLAMGATPRAAVAAWTVPADLDDDAIAAIARGQRAAADLLGMSIVGGNLASAPVLSITTTVLGEADRVVARSGARPGDALVLVGPVGEAALGIVALSRGAEVERAILAYRRPPVLLAESRALAEVATSMIDVSDGLAQDVGHLAERSGARFVIDAAALARVRAPSIEGAARALGVDIEALELAGGDDYALVATVAAPSSGMAVIGFVEGGAGVEILRGEQRAAAPAGYVHR